MGVAGPPMGWVARARLGATTSTVAIYVLFFASGATSLVFELIWLRGFAVLLGSTLYAMSCVLTAFTLGLALGSLFARRFVARSTERGPAFFVGCYGILELAIGISGLLLTVVLFRAQEDLFGLLAAVPEPSLAATVSLHFVVSFVLMAIPTVCMGATLPVLCMGLERDVETPSLYGCNTIGAAVGALGASFVLIYHFGCTASAGIAAAINAALCLAALAIAYSMRRRSDPVGRAITEDGSEPAPGSPPWSPAAALGLAFFSGYVFFSYELVWNRVLGLILGNRVYVTSITLFLVLACLAVGASISRRLRSRVEPRNLLLGGYGTAVVSTLMAALAQDVVLQSRPSAGAAALYVAGLIGLPAIAMGVVLPLLLMLPERGSVRGVHVGRLYAGNLVGSVVGSLLTGYVLIGSLGSGRLLLLNAALLVLALWAFARPEQGWGWRKGGLVVAYSLFACGMLLWRWSAPISVVPSENRIVLEEDSHGIFSIQRLRDGFLSVRNNATKLVYHYGHKKTQFVQESQAHFPAAVAPRLERVAVIGSGYGITAGTFGRYPVERVDSVEILPLMVKHGEYFREGTHDYLHNPRIRIHITDGRRFLAMASEPYDIISINVSDPYLSGSSSLFSREFYALVKKKLRPGGIVCQHIFGPDIVSLYHGFKAHFEFVRAVPAYANGLSLLGSDEPIRPRRRELVEAVPIAGMTGNVSREDFIVRVLEKGDGWVRVLQARVPDFLNSDDFPHLEFRRSAKVDTFFSNN